MLPEKVSHGPQNTPQLSPHFHFFYRWFLRSGSLFPHSLSTRSPYDRIRVFVLFFWCYLAHHANHLRRTKKQNAYQSIVYRFSWFRRHGDGIDNFFQFRFNSQKGCHRNIKKCQAAHDYKGQTFQLFVHNVHWTQIICVQWQILKISEHG